MSIPAAKRLGGTWTVLEHRITSKQGIVVEHKLDVLKAADWVINLGPEGGIAGGQLIAEGTPEDVAKVDRSYTGQRLREML